MPDRTTQKTVNRFEALLDMIEADGASPAGQLPPASHVTALRQADGIDPEAIRSVRNAHANGNSPPENPGQG